MRRPNASGCRDEIGWRRDVPRRDFNVFFHVAMSFLSKSLIIFAEFQNFRDRLVEKPTFCNIFFSIKRRYHESSNFPRHEENYICHMKEQTKRSIKTSFPSRPFSENVHLGSSEVTRGSKFIPWQCFEPISRFLHQFAMILVSL